MKLGKLTDIEALALLLEMAAPRYGGNMDGYLTDIGIVVGGLDATGIIPEQIDSSNPLNQYCVSYDAFVPETTGFLQELNPRNDNQVRHFLAGASGSNRGGVVAEAILLRRERDTPEDYELFEKSFEFVDFLYGMNHTHAGVGTTRLGSAGEWVRNNLAK